MSSRIHPRVEQISTQFNGIGVELYLVRGERNIIIDTGIYQSPQRDILPSLKNLGGDLSDINLILNTHGHFDHTAGNTVIKAISGAQVLIHKDDAPFMYDREHCFELYLAPVVSAMGNSLHKEKQSFIQMLGPEMFPDQQLEEGDIIHGGRNVELKVVHLPGHTLGCIGLFWEREGILFTGDSVVGLHTDGGKLPVIFNLSAYIKSLKRLQEMPIQLLLCGHHYRGISLPSSPLRKGQEVKQFLQDCQEVAVRLDDAVREVVPHIPEKTFMQLADEVITHLPREMGFKPMTQVQRPLYSAQTIFFQLYQKS
jgi:glyoxylase-like metal-dependent hydrolase (beta-lactamase superfamily II)